MYGRTRLKQELMKQHHELERKREEDDMQRRRDMAGIQQSSSVDVPAATQNPPPTVNVEVPPNIMEVRRNGDSTLCVHLCVMCVCVMCVFMYACVWSAICTQI